MIPSFTKATIVTLTQVFETSSGRGSSLCFSNPIDDTPYQWKVFMTSTREAQNSCALYFQCTHTCSSEDLSTKKVLLPYVCAFRFSLSTRNQLAFYSNEVNWSLFQVKLGENFRIDTPGKAIKAKDLDGIVTVSFALSVITDPEVLQRLEGGGESPLPSENGYCARNVPGINIHLWKSRDLADLVIEAAGGAEVAVHKCFLFGSSPTFLAMFSASDSKKRHSDRVVLSHLSIDIVNEMVKFLYLEYVDTDDIEVLCTLLSVANDYSMVSLKTACTQSLMGKLYKHKSLAGTTLALAAKLNLPDLKFMSENILVKSQLVNSNNAVEWLRLAADSAAEFLSGFAVDHLLLRKKIFTDDKSWKNFAKSYPRIATSILSEFPKPRNLVCGKHVCKMYNVA